MACWKYCLFFCNFSEILVWLLRVQIGRCVNLGENNDLLFWYIKCAASNWTISIDPPIPLCQVSVYTPPPVPSKTGNSTIDKVLFIKGFPEASHCKGNERENVGGIFETIGAALGLMPPCLVMSTHIKVNVSPYLANHTILPHFNNSQLEVASFKYNLSDWWIFAYLLIVNVCSNKQPK